MDENGRKVMIMYFNRAREAGGVGKWQVTYLMSLGKWMAEQRQIGMVKGQMLFEATKTGSLWRAMIAYIPKRHGT